MQQNNVFVLCTGRCGSSTFAAASGHIENFTSAHESRTYLVGDDRFAYPSEHIEVDNRLSWLLGRLDKTFGDNAFYVHLKRDLHATARSFIKRQHGGILKAYRKGILQQSDEHSEATDMEFCLDYCRTVDANIELFLRDKSHTMTFHMESAETDFPAFWEWIGARGNLEQAMSEWSHRHNASPQKTRRRFPITNLRRGLLR